MVTGVDQRVCIKHSTLQIHNLCLELDAAGIKWAF